MRRMELVEHRQSEKFKFPKIDLTSDEKRKKVNLPANAHRFRISLRFVTRRNQRSTNALPRAKSARREGKNRRQRARPVVCNRNSAERNQYLISYFFFLFLPPPLDSATLLASNSNSTLLSWRFRLFSFQATRTYTLVFRYLSFRMP